MFLTIAFVVGVLGHLSSGIPLESPSADLEQFFGSRIVGGSDAAAKRAPHMAALVVGYFWTSLMCGASIISDRCILTAAHCVPVNWDGSLMDTFHAMVGSNTWHSGTVVELGRPKLHPDYDSWNIKNDIAVLTSKKKIELSKRVAPVALRFDHVAGGQESFATGWGTQSLWGNVPNELQILYLRSISYKKCLADLNEVAAITGGWVPPLDYKTEVCALHSVGHGMCHGDSGSALVSVNKKQPRGEDQDCSSEEKDSSGEELAQLEEQYGIVSWGMWPCAEGWPDVYVRVSAFKDFILACIEGRC